MVSQEPITSPVDRKSFLAAMGVVGATAAATLIPASPAAAEPESITPVKHYNVKDYGATGDGVTDDSAAFQSALGEIANQRAVERAGVLYIPTGNYRFDSRVIVEVGEFRLTILGDGQGVSRLFSANADGIIKIDSFSRANQVTVRDLSFFADQPSAGTAFEMVQPEGGNRHNRSLVMENVEARGVDHQADYFEYCYRVIGGWRPLFHGVIAAGPFGPTVNKKDPDSLAYAAAANFVVDGSYAPAFSYCYSWDAAVGYSLRSTRHPGPEDAALYRSFAVGNKVGVDVSTVDWSGEPQLEIDTCHFNCLEAGIRLENRKYFQITNCLMYNFVFQDDETPIPYADIELIGSFGGIIAGNIFHQPNNTERKQIDIKSGCSDIAVRDNLFNAGGTVVRVAEDVTNVRVTHNDFRTGVDPMAGLQLVNTVIDDASDQAIFVSDEFRGATVSRNEDYDVSTDEWTELPWQESTFDSSGFFSADDDPGGLIIPSNLGVKLVRLSTSAVWAGEDAVGGVQEIRILKNGEPFIGGAVATRPASVPGPDTDGGGVQSVSTAVVSVSSGDRFSVSVRHTASESTQIAGGASTWFSIEAVDG